MTRVLHGTYSNGIDLTALSDESTTVFTDAKVYDGLKADNGYPMQIYVDGTVSGVRFGVYLTHGGVVSVNGLIDSYYVAGSALWVNGGRGTIGNAGFIRAPEGLGVQLSAGGLVTNSGVIYGRDGVYAATSATTVINRGQIIASTTSALGNGVSLGAGGIVDNQSVHVVGPNVDEFFNGTISGYRGVVGSGGAVQVSNTSVIAGNMTASGGRGAYLRAGGSVTNASTGVISGYEGVYGRSNVSITNAGTIQGNQSSPYGSGIILFQGGSVTNQSSGTIAGNIGIFGPGLVAVENAGTISGTTYAVLFNSDFQNLLKVDPGAVFLGNVYGGNSVLELASGASAGTLSGIGSQFQDFQSFRVDAGASWTLTGTTMIDAGTYLVNKGTLTIQDAVLSDFGAVFNYGAILIDPSSVTIYSLYGPGRVDVGAGSTLTITNIVGSGETIAFTSDSGTLTIDPTQFSGEIDGLAIGDVINLTGVTDAGLSAIVNGNTLEIHRSGHAALDLTLDPGRDFSSITFGVDAAGVLTADETPCFLRGTLIRTARGEIAVQDLVIGDRITTLTGGLRPITWIGMGKVGVNPGKRSAATPVIVRRHALADGVPYDDLRITKGHSLFIDSVLIPAEFLVNHRTILWDDHKRDIEFYHIEFEVHDVLFANGAPCESYRDDGNRWLFQNANSNWDRSAKPACAPVLTDGSIVDAIWRRLVDRDLTRIPLNLTDDPDLHLLVNDMKMRVCSRTESRHSFRLTSKPRTVRIVSRTAAPAEIGMSRDVRSLGVAISQIMLSKGARLRVIDAEDPALANGFHGFESSLGLRWTDGDAAIPTTLFDGFDGAMTLELCLAGATQYPVYTEAGVGQSA